jgi:hypothetical protein
MSERCPGCGALYSLVGRVHNCSGALLSHQPLLRKAAAILSEPNLKAARDRIAELEADLAELKAQLGASQEALAAALNETVTERNAGVTHSVTRPKTAAERQKAWRERKKRKP